MANNSGGAAASWQQDPFGRHDQRWWDGHRWTEKVRTAGVVGIDAPGVDATPISVASAERVRPITDATAPVVLEPVNLPRVLLIAVLVLVGIVVVVVAALVA